MRLLRSLPVAPLLLSAMAWGCGPDGDTLNPGRFPLIPIPADIDARRGDFNLNPETRISLSHPDDLELRDLVDRWASSLRELSGFPLPILDTPATSGRNLIRIGMTGTPDDALAGVAAGMGLPGIEAERYELKVSPRRVELEAPAMSGVFYGLKTLSQLIPDGESSSPWAIPAVEIEDVPRFAYRGMHLDVGRHFFPVSFIKRYIDLLATYKMNVCHERGSTPSICPPTTGVV